MLLTRIRAENFLSLRHLDLSLDSPLTFITGPNGVGKTNIARCLDVVTTVLNHHTGRPDIDRLVLYESAARDEATSYSIELTLEFDQDWEKQLLTSYVQAAFIAGEAYSFSSMRLEAAAQNIDQATLQPLLSGSLKLNFDSSRIGGLWWAAYEFTHLNNQWHIPLIGGTSLIEPGPATPFLPIGGAQLSFTRLMLGIDNPGPSDLERSIKELANGVDLRTALVKMPDQRASFEISPAFNTSGRIPQSLKELASALQIKQIINHTVTFAQLLAVIFRRTIVLTDNRRVPLKRHYDSTELEAPLDLRSGRNLAGELFRLKNGKSADRSLYAEAKKTFTFLTGQTFGLATTVSSTDLLIEPLAVTTTGERPIEFSGAGVQEALLLSTLLSGPPGRFLVLDEPAVNLEPTMQRRLISQLRKAGRCMVVTHSPDMVPVERKEDLAGIVRLSPGAQGPVVCRVGDVPETEWARFVQLLEPSHVRALLFASCVILCEGSTEVGALSQWWRDTASLNLPDPEAANIPIISVDGDKRFGPYIDYLDAFGIPWAIIADGPALRDSSQLAKHLAHRYPNFSTPLNNAGFEECRDYWRCFGVFTLAEQFGDDGHKQGEFEAYLERVDSHALAMARSESGRSKPRCGASFAANVSRPQEVADLYLAIMQRFESITQRAFEIR
ncbi:TOPRIM nucleotidyl transferase/hydrolase domain-containing protein [Microbispora siamensis]|uniref:AAA family ATPase n=1 Tax=Microbispora siamensis TaxID=564413 RepID=A0ABQ4GZX1_9ACTN|nr:TOPRIM nucleotidyl transferase/hydrolase domain-containing protein [Microbispora siamensis]GIH66983.1 hypothetical protein Msi02_78000 [Microbispora siamensis]